jgi:predicted MPP superfamily phosphohydrolase
MRTVTYLTRRSMLSKGALAIVGGAVVGASAWSDAEELPLVRRVTLSHPRLPSAFDGLRVVQVSDVHAGAFMPPERLEHVRRVVESLSPDLIAFTGDQLDRRAVDADLFVQGFAGLTAPLGVFGVLGNHDHQASPELGIAALDAIGAVPLVNATAEIAAADQRLAVIGVDDLEGSPGRRPDFSVVRSHAGSFRLVLCHQPRGWRRARRSGAEIMLAGHTHGAQIAFPSRGVNIARLSTRYLAGPYRKDSYLLYVSRGVGVGAVPLRYGAPPEVDLITLRRAPLDAA